MLRLAHRMQSNNPVWPDRLIHPNDAKLCLPLIKFDQKIAERCPTVILDNVADYYAKHDQLVWDIRTDFPNCAPPFTHCLFEWKIPTEWNISGELEHRKGGETCGLAMIAAESQKIADIATAMNVPLMRAICAGMFVPPCVDQGENQRRIEDAFLRSKWCCRFSFWLAGSHFSGRPIWSSAYAILLVGEGGGVVDYGFIGHSVPAYLKEDRSALDSTMHVALLGISFMHCRNVNRIDATGTEGPPEKWLKRQKKAAIRYYTLDIDSMSGVLCTEGGIEQNGLKKALHICRGHFATYTDDKPLFGKVTGTFWKPQHVRGSAKEGVVVKDYAVKAPVLVDK